MKRLSSYLPAASIFALALLVRVVYNLTAARGYIPEYDGRAFNDIALTILQRHCFCRTDRAPLWPYLIAALSFFLGVHTLYPRLFLSLLGSATCVLIYLFARDLFGKRTAFITGLLAAIYTGLFIYDGWLYAESLYTFLITAFVYALSRFQGQVSARLPEMEGRKSILATLANWGRRTAQRRWVMVSGLCLGLATLTRPNGVFLFGLVLVWAVLVIRARILPWSLALKAACMILVLAACLLAPWTYRNFTRTGTFLLVATGGGIVLAGAYNDVALQGGRTKPGMWTMDFSPPINYHGHNCCDYRGEAYNTAHALQWIQTHLRDMPYLLSLHFINMWLPYTPEDALPVREFPTRLSSRIVWQMMLIMPMPFFLLAALGLVVTWKRWKKQLLVVYLMILFTIVQNMAFYGSSRFRAPIEPLIVLFVGGSIWWLSCDEPGTLRFRLREKRSSGPRKIMHHAQMGNEYPSS